MHVKNIMSSSVQSVQRHDDIAAAARLMGENDVGFLPVLDGRKIVGVVTDRDITVRGVGAGIGPDEPVSRVMTKNPITCTQDTDVEKALDLMSKEQVRRLPVCGGEEDLIGVVTLADAAERDFDKREVAEALREICEPAGVHNQSRELA